MSESTVHEVTDEGGHGHSPAAWTSVIVMLIATTLGTIFFYLDMPVLVWASAGLLVVGGLLGIVLAKLGYGVKGPKYQPKGH